MEYRAPPPLPYAMLLLKDDALTFTTAADKAAIAPPDSLEMQSEKLVLMILTTTDQDSAAKAPPIPIAEHAWSTLNSFRKIGYIICHSLSSFQGKNFAPINPYQQDLDGRCTMYIFYSE